MNTSVQFLPEPRLDMIENFCKRVKKQLRKERKRRQQQHHLLAQQHYRGGVLLGANSRYVDAVWQTWLEDLALYNIDTPPGLNDIAIAAQRLAEAEANGVDVVVQTTATGTGSAGAGEGCLSPGRSRFFAAADHNTTGQIVRSPHSHQHQSPAGAGVGGGRSASPGVGFAQLRSTSPGENSGVLFGLPQPSYSLISPRMTPTPVGGLSPMVNGRQSTSGRQTRFVPVSYEVLTIQELQMVLEGDLADQAGITTTTYASSSYQRANLVWRLRKGRRRRGSISAADRAAGAEGFRAGEKNGAKRLQQEGEGSHGKVALAPLDINQIHLRPEDPLFVALHGITRTTSGISASATSMHAREVAMLWPAPGISRDRGATRTPLLCSTNAATGPITTSTGGWAAMPSAMPDEKEDAFSNDSGSVVLSKQQQHTHTYTGDEGVATEGGCPFTIFQELTASEFSSTSALFPAVPASRESPFFLVPDANTRSCGASGSSRGKMHQPGAAMPANHNHNHNHSHNNNNEEEEVEEAGWHDMNAGPAFHQHVLHHHPTAGSAALQEGGFMKGKRLQFDFDTVPPVVRWEVKKKHLAYDPLNDGMSDASSATSSSASSVSLTSNRRDRDSMAPRHIMDPFFLETVLSRLPQLRSLILCDTPLPPINDHMILASVPSDRRRPSFISRSHKNKRVIEDPPARSAPDVEEEVEELPSDKDPTPAYRHDPTQPPLAPGVNAVLGLPLGYRNWHRRDTPAVPPPVPGFPAAPRRSSNTNKKKKTQQHAASLTSNPQQQQQDVEEIPHRKGRSGTLQPQDTVLPSPVAPEEEEEEEEGRGGGKGSHERRQRAAVPFPALRELHIIGCTLSGGRTDPLIFSQTTRAAKPLIPKTPGKPQNKRSPAPGAGSAGSGAGSYPLAGRGFNMPPPLAPPLTAAEQLGGGKAKTNSPHPHEVSITQSPKAMKTGSRAGLLDIASSPGCRSSSGSGSNPSPRPPPLSEEKCQSNNTGGTASAMASHPLDMRAQRPSWTLSATGVAVETDEHQENLQHPRGGSRYGVDAKELARLVRIGERRLLGLEDGRHPDKEVEDYIAAWFTDGSLLDLRWIRCVPHLRHLSLDRCSLQDQNMSWIAELKHLAFFSATHSNVRRVDWLEGVSNTLTDLNLSHCPWLVDVKGIRHLSRLRHLSLSFTPIHSAAFVRACRDLESLHLQCCRRLVVANDIGRLNKLRVLNISRTAVRSLSWLSECSPGYLECVDVSYCHFCSPGAVAVLQDLPQLKYANISGMYMDPASMDLWPGNELYSTRGRSASSTQLLGTSVSGSLARHDSTPCPPNFSLEWLRGCKQLRELWFLDAGDKVRDIEAITQLAPSLRLLHLTHTVNSHLICDVHWLSPMSHLTLLNLSENTKLRDVSGLRNLRHLRQLSLAGTDVADSGLLDALVPSCTSTLQGIDLSYCKSLKHFEVLEQLPHLRQVFLSGTNISRLEWVNRCPGLDTLYLNDCAQLRDAQPLRRATNMRSLRVDYSPITSISFVPKMERLTDLNLAGCTNVYDYEYLGRNINLQTLDVSFTCVCEATWLRPLQMLEELRICYCSGIDYLYELLELRHLRVVDIEGTELCLHKDRLDSLRTWAQNTGVLLLYQSEDTFTMHRDALHLTSEDGWKGGQTIARAQTKDSTRISNANNKPLPPLRSAKPNVSFSS
eukprot:gene6993-4957_t